MSNYGLQVYNSSGLKVIDTSTRNYQQIIDVGLITAPGSLSLLGLTGSELISTTVTPDPNGETSVPPKIQVSGNTVSWSAGASGTIRAELRVNIA